VRQQAAFAYRSADSLSYRDRLASVRPVDEPEVANLQVSAAIHADDALVAVAKDCIREGIVKRMDLMAAIAQRSKCGRRKAEQLLDKYTGDDPVRHHWTFSVQARGAKVYRLLVLEPPAEGSHAPAKGATQEAGHE
jgi:hypothetical protein